MRKKQLLEKGNEKKDSFWIDEQGHDYRIPFAFSMVSLGCSILAILVRLFLL